MPPNSAVIPDLSAKRTEMKKNVIILTLGLSGSSVLTGLIARAGYWTGDDTFKKEYDTYENRELIRLNSELLAAADYRKDYTSEFSCEAIKQVSSLRGKLDLADYRNFLAQCEARRPWIWKDPRFYLTIRFWKDLLDFEQIKVILLTRDKMQAWISQQLRRQVCTYSYFRRYDDGVRESLVGFLKDNRIPYLVLQYDDLILRPEEALASLNRYIDASLTVDDLKAIYTGRLYKKSKSYWDLAKAVAIYAKNYSERQR